MTEDVLYRAVFSVNGTRQVVSLSRAAISWSPYHNPTSFPPIVPDSPVFDAVRNNSVAAFDSAASSSDEGSDADDDLAPSPAFTGATTVPTLSATASSSSSQDVVLALKDVCVLTRSGPRSFALHCLCVFEKDPNLPRVYVRHEFALVGPYAGYPQPSNTPNEEPCAGWMREVRTAMHGVNGDPADRMPVLVLVNPFSGTKRGAAIWETECAPLLAAAGLAADVVETQRAGDAYDRAKTLQINSHSAIVTVGGDGILNEVINGLMSREDWTEAIGIPVAPVPAGTGNAGAHSLYNTMSAACIACHVVKNSTKKSDIFLAAQPSLSQYMWGVLNGSYGIVAEADFGSERIRWLGSLRTSVWAFYRILCGSLYRCRITYLSTDAPRQSWYGIKCTRDCQLCRSAILHHTDKNAAADLIDSAAAAAPPMSPSPQRSPAPEADTPELADNLQAPVQSQPQPAVSKATNTPAAFGPGYTSSLTQTDQWVDGVPSQFAGLFSGYAHHTVGQPVPPGWAVHDNLSISFCTFQKLPWLQPGMLVAPFAHLADGCMDVCYATSEAFSRVSFMKFFGTFPEGGHVNSPKLSYLKVKSFTVEPIDTDGFIGVDGERIKFAPIQFHVAQGLLNFLCYA